MNALWPLSRVQYGLETTAGTLVAADTLLPLESGSYEPQIERTALEEARGVLVQVDDLDVRKGSMLTISQFLDYEHVALPLLTGFDNAAAVGVSAPYTRTFEPGLTAPEGLASASFEVVETDGASDLFEAAFAYGSCEQCSINLAFNQPATLSATYFGRAEQSVAAATGLSALARKVIRSSDFEIAIDDTWAGLGTTKRAATIRSAQLQLTSGAAPGYTLDGATDLDFTKLYRGRLSGSLQLVLDLNATAMGEVGKWRDGALRFVELKATDGTGAALRSLTLQLALRFIETPQVLQHDGDIVTVGLTGELRYDATSGKALRVELKNAISGY